MKVANNMDSVFADSTKDELDFELMFDDDDCLIDLVEGYDEMGNLMTGENPEEIYEMQLDEEGNDPIADKCDCGQREGNVKPGNEAPEGSEKNQDGDFETPEGMTKEVPGTGNSAESKADEVTPEIKDAIGEEADPIEDKDDAEQREGKVDKSGSVEGEKQEVVGAAQEAASEKASEKEEICEGCGKPISECTCSVSEAIIRKVKNESVDTSKETDKDIDKKIKSEEDSKLDGEAIEDKDDAAQREGEVDKSGSVEGEKQEVVGAAQEAASDDNIDAQLSPADTVPDDVQNDGAANNIPYDAVTQSSDGIEPATEEVVYKGWTTSVTEAKKEKEDKKEDTVVDTEDDGDIEMVNNGDFEKDSKLELDVDYDDDELIDIAMNGGSID
jgi:hypothetical protein